MRAETVEIGSKDLTRATRPGHVDGEFGWGKGQGVKGHGEEKGAKEKACGNGPHLDCLIQGAGKDPGMGMRTGGETQGHDREGMIGPGMQRFWCRGGGGGETDDGRQGPDVDGGIFTCRDQTDLIIGKSKGPNGAVVGDPGDEEFTRGQVPKVDTTFRRGCRAKGTLD